MVVTRVLSVFAARWCHHRPPDRTAITQAAANHTVCRRSGPVIRAGSGATSPGSRRSPASPCATRVDTAFARTASGPLPGPASSVGPVVRGRFSGAASIWRRAAMTNRSRSCAASSPAAAANCGPAAASARIPSRSDVLICPSPSVARWHRSISTQTCDVASRRNSRSSRRRATISSSESTACTGTRALAKNSRSSAMSAA